MSAISKPPLFVTQAFELNIVNHMAEKAIRAKIGNLRSNVCGAGWADFTREHGASFVRWRKLRKAKSWTVSVRHSAAPRVSGSTIPPLLEPGQCSEPLECLHNLALAFASLFECGMSCKAR